MWDSKVKILALAGVAGLGVAVTVLSRHVLRRRTRHRREDPPSTVQLVLISDPGQDLDDEMTFIMLRHLVEEGLVALKGVVATLAPAFDRARLCKGTLDTLGFHGVPVGVGTDGGDTTGMHKASTFEDWASRYMPSAHSESAASVEPGRRLLYRLYSDAAPKSITMVIIAALKDPALFLRDHESLFVAKTCEVVIMGGVEPWEGNEGFLVPDSANNNTFDPEASKFFYRRCQELGVRLIVVSRWAAYAVKLPRYCYDELAGTGSSIGCRLRNAQRASIESLWERACATGDARRGLPARCDRRWFTKTFCSGKDDPSRDGGDAVWDLVEGFMQYDTITLLAALPQLRARYMRPAEVTGHDGTRHLVIGCSEQDHNVVNPKRLVKILQTGFKQGLSLNHSYRAHYILLLQPRWNNRADEMMACVVLRALYEVGILDCIGIVISPGPGDPVDGVPQSGQDDDEKKSREAGEMLHQVHQEIRSILSALGLGHVPVLLSTSYGRSGGPGEATGTSHLLKLYSHAPPAGVLLVVAACTGDAADFAETHPTIFCEKTQSVIVMGGATITAELDAHGEPTGQSILEPDPAAQFNSLDMDAAKRFLRQAQNLLVPLVIISRHFAHATQIARVVFDTLADYGGRIGADVCHAHKSSMERLWRLACTSPSDKAPRCGLPARCDRQWFIKAFCNNKAPENEEDIWSAISHFTMYSAMAVLLAVPAVRQTVTEGTEIKVRSVTHSILGLSTETSGVKDLIGLHSLLVHCVFLGVRLNTSDFNFARPPPIRISYPDVEAVWEFDERDEALDWLHPSIMASLSNLPCQMTVCRQSSMNSQHSSHNEFAKRQ
mmetsp:Transcript_62693/g.176791  ORF Transcript_62693/g.176791 Transcript_62693/m.176791 type:complete len:836 (-) Transcript_62693:168-2675(-)